LNFFLAFSWSVVFKFVSHPPGGKDEFGLVHVLFNLGTKAVDVRIHGMFKSFEINPPYLIEEVGTGIGFSWIFGQEYQHVKLLGGKFLLLIVGFYDAFGDIQVKVFELDDFSQPGG
jgi:hypothetical protein